MIRAHTSSIFCALLDQGQIYGWTFTTVQLSGCYVLKGDHSEKYEIDFFV